MNGEVKELYVKQTEVSEREKMTWDAERRGRRGVAIKDEKE